MATVLTTLSVFGTVVVVGFLIRNLIKRPGAIANAKFPAYMRLSYNRSHAVCLCFIVPWGAAAFNAADYRIWWVLMLSPMFFVVASFVASSRLMERQSPEIHEYGQDLAKNSWEKRVMDGLNGRG